MKKTAAAALLALLALTTAGCGQANEPAVEAADGAAAPEAGQATTEENSFADFMQGTWLCKGETDYVRAHLPYPGISGSSYRLDRGSFIVGDGTFDFLVDKGVSITGTWEMEGRTLTVTSDLGTQVVENMPETWDYALEPVDTVFVGADGRDDETVRVQALGQRQVSIETEYASHCTKS